MNLPTVRFAATLLFALSAASAAAPAPAHAAPTSVALLPSVGPADEDDRRDVDAALRKALRDDETLDLQSPVDTREFLVSVADMGLVCVPEDIPCLAKFGILAKVEWVLVPEVKKPTGSGDSRTIRIVIGAVEAATGKLARTVDEEVTLADEEAIGALARKAMNLSSSSGTGDPNPPDKDPPDTDPPDKDPPDKDPPDPPDPATAPPSPGVLLAGIGGVVAGVSLVGAIVSDLVFLNVISANKETRESMVPVGAVLWGTTAIGAITAGVGAYLLSEEANAAPE